MLALGGLIFEILGGFWRSSIFDEILGRPKVDQNLEKSGIVWPVGLQTGILGGFAAGGGALGEVRRGQAPPNSERKAGNFESSREPAKFGMEKKEKENWE